MMKRIGWWEKELPFQVLAVNGPFPVPIWAADGFREAYAWYFRDTERGFTIVSPNETADRVFRLVQHLDLADVPSVVFGFSQGGYLAPFLAPLLKNLRSIIALGSGYPIDVYRDVAPMIVFGVHGDQDERIPMTASRDAHAQLLKRGFTGEFHVAPGLTHRVDVAVESLVRRLVLESLDSPARS